MSSSSSSSPVIAYHGNQLGDPNIDTEMKSRATNVKAWGKPYPLPGGEAIYFGVSSLDGDADEILIPFSGTAIINFNSTFSDGFAFKYQARADEDIFTSMNDVLDTVHEKIRKSTPTSELEQKLSADLNTTEDYPRKDGGVNAKLRVKNGIMLTTFGSHVDFDAFKKKAMVFIAKKKPVSVAGVFLVQGAVLSKRGLDVCVKLWEVSVRR
jgi:hypothetical protein